MSCATCHDPEKAFTDGRSRARGAGGKELLRNTLALVNLGALRSYFWDGRAASLEEQALVPITAPDEMNQNLDELERELQEIPVYSESFRSVFGTAVARQGIAAALAAFERTLVSRNAPVDRFLTGEADALSPSARSGWELFRGAAGCIRCHGGPDFTDSRFYRIGAGSRSDPGRGAVTGSREDMYKFRTPSLRNVAETAPYMHDGSLATLGDVVQFYYRFMPLEGPDGLPLDAQPLLGQSFSEVSDLVAFLEALSGELPRVALPGLP